MFVANNTIVSTENGLQLAESIFDEIYSLNSFIKISKNETKKDSIFIKTELFPSFSIGKDTSILTGRLLQRDNQVVINNDFCNASNIREGNYLYIPKISYDCKNSFNRTLIWLYAKYLASGYFCTEAQTNEPTIIIKPKRFSKKESVKLKAIDGISFNLDKKIIFIKNKKIIEEFNKNKDNLSWNIYGSKNNLIEYFLYTLKVEGQISVEKKTLAYDIFMLFYSRLNKIFKIVEVKENTNKSFLLMEANESEYFFANDKLYTRVVKVLDGKIIKGIEIENIEKNILYASFFLLK